MSQQLGAKLTHSNLFVQQRTQHPRSFLVDLHALRQQIGGGLVTGLIDNREYFSRRACHSFLPFHEQPYHLRRLGHATGLFDRREPGVFGVGARCRKAERANAFGGGVNSITLLHT